MAKKLSLFNSIVAAIAVCISSASAEQKVYWTSTGPTKGIFRANIDGSNIEPVYQSPSNGPDEPRRIAIDDVNQKIYWTVHNQGRIQRSNLDGSGLEPFIDGLLAGPQNIAIDPITQHVYWTSDDLNLRRLAIGQAGQLGSIVLNTFGGYSEVTVAPFLNLIISNVDQQDQFYQQTASGFSPVSQPAPLELESNNFISILHVSERILYFEPLNREIRTISVGGGQGTILPKYMLQGFEIPTGFAANREENVYFWTDETAGTIRRVNDGSNEPTVFFDGVPLLQAPYGIAIDCGAFAPDSDSDGFVNCMEECPSDPAKQGPGLCGCGIPDSLFNSNCMVPTATPTPTFTPTLTPTPSPTPIFENATPTALPATPTPAENVPEIRILDGATKLIFPPLVIVKNKTVKIILEKFSKFVFKPNNKNIRAGKVPKLTYRYKVNIKNKSAKTKDIFTLNAKRNELTVKNLKPGNYAVNYQIEFLQEGKTIKRSNISPSSTFQIQ